VIVEEKARWQRCGGPLDGTKEDEVCGGQIPHLFQHSDPVSCDADLRLASVCVRCLHNMLSAAPSPKASPTQATPNQSYVCVCILIQRIADLLPTLLVYCMIEISARGTFTNFGVVGHSRVDEKV
jgi:hypothetical protein